MYCIYIYLFIKFRILLKTLENPCLQDLPPSAEKLVVPGDGGGATQAVAVQQGRVAASMLLGRTWYDHCIYIYILNMFLEVFNAEYLIIIIDNNAYALY